MNKQRVLKDYESLDVSVTEQIKLQYQEGFERNLIRIQNKEGKYLSALPFETEDKYYLIRMTILEARELIEEDDDYDNSGHLKHDIIEEYEEKYEDG